MVGYDIFGNKLDVKMHSISDVIYRKIFFPEIAEKILLLLENRPLMLKDLIYGIYGICGSGHYNEGELKSTLSHIAYFTEGEFKHELETYMDSNKSTILRILLEGEIKKDDYNKLIDIVRLKKECRALLDTYKYLEA